MTKTTTTDQQIAEMQLAIAEMRAELDRRDIEQLTMENAIEFLDRLTSNLRWIVGSTTLAMFGRNHEQGQRMLSVLYPEPVNGVPNLQAPVLIFRHPARRWTQFGTKSALRQRAEVAGVPKAAQLTREGLVRALWALRELPGSIALLRSYTHDDKVNAG